ncbi:MAG: hypothetical protein JWM16_4371 [Verrucomicrobiales bacterium]|nr:hypothetical protein [Verrucomicrobiales bacterium]
MANSSSPAIASASFAAESRATAGFPIYFYLLVFGAVCIPLGVLWDISWHSTIGRDTFWTPAHMLTYMGGLVPGLTCGWLAVKTHFFGTPAERAASVSFWGFRAPLGCWVTIWGTFMMLLSAPFDNWWHDAYGLDVQILSPPHSVLAVGMLAVNVGVLLQMLSLQNRQGAEFPHAKWMFILTGGVLLLMAAVFLTEESFPNSQHSGRFYVHASITFPLYLVAAGQASRLRWPATTVAAVYMGLVLFMCWILPLFSAEPKLAPIYNPVTRMVPPAFPLLLFVPALGMDLLLQRLGHWRGWWRSLLLAGGLSVAFMGLFVPTQWYFSKFLLTPAADNWFFVGNRYWWYFAHPGDHWHRFWYDEPWSKDPVTMQKLALCVLYAFLSTRIGLAFGRWMAGVKR